MIDYENILEALTKQKIHRSQVFLQLFKLVKKENLKNGNGISERVHEKPGGFLTV